MPRLLSGAVEAPGQIVGQQGRLPSTGQATRLDGGTKLDRGWSATVYPEAGEIVAVGSLIGEDAAGRRRVVRVTRPWPARSSGIPARPESTERAERRARGQIRRYAVRNGCTRLCTLTYAVPVHDPATARRDFAGFSRRLRRARPDVAWVRTFERHQSGAVHVHVALSAYVPKQLLAALWGHGFIDVRKIRVRAGGRESARVAARYVAKYVGKDAAATSGDHRYEVREGYQLRKVSVQAWSWAEVLEGARAAGYVSGRPVYVWSSSTDPTWLGPPVIFAAF